MNLKILKIPQNNGLLNTPNDNDMADYDAWEDYFKEMNIRQAENDWRDCEYI